VVLFFYPADFTFVCPTEVMGFHREREAFRKLGVKIFGVSADSVESHRAWAKELGGIDYPLLSDADGAVSAAYGVLDRRAGVPRRVTFVIDPDGAVAYVVASHHNVGRSVEETLRVVAALQTGRLCPADWHPGDPTSDLSPKY
jgi:alkyl hydroperoxide reductase subunit AhpC